MTNTIKDKMSFVQKLLLVICLSSSITGTMAKTNTLVQTSKSATTNRDIKDMKKVTKTEKEWKEELTPEQFSVTRQCSTEIPFTGKYNNWKEKGVFKCVCCGAVLFDSEHKFDSGSGWPSFWDAAQTENIEKREDNSLGMQRVEVLCKQCEAHLGHLFTDGPPPTRQRYCINSAALKFEEKK